MVLMSCSLRRATVSAAVLLTLGIPSGQASAQQPARARSDSDSVANFAALVRRLSSAGGQFDTDNLISNEKGYQQVLGAVDRLGLRGGAYIGVGPDQNFTYIAQLRPRIAFIADVRRDNMLQHLLFKALFARARNRAEYLALWTGRRVPDDPEAAAVRPLQELVTRLDATPFDQVSAQRAKRLVREELQRSGILLSGVDLMVIERFHDAFISAGLSLRFTSTGRAPQPYYPTLRQLILEHDAAGRMRSYLASEESFQFVKDLQRRNLVVPVTGDLGDTRTLAGIGRLLNERGDRLTALYVSNVEDYLLRDGTFAAYLAGVRALPRANDAVVIRSYFGGGYGHPEATDEYYATQLLQRLDPFVSDTALQRPMRYRELVNRNWIPLRRP
jgi:hypothetical protein